ncbi:AAA family ATPase, partial [Aeromicrobium alkaliterrae]|uniref:AAA family ATPase n=1 Tax=Aeromicrobium alkaliterrae TaxID=302168 RepID=UPI0031DFF5D9
REQWRSLDADFWSDDRPAGSRTIIYGHNGSGKSTLAEMLLGIAEGDCTTSVVWEDPSQRPVNLDQGPIAAPAPMAVFTKKWVQANLDAFLSGDRATAIVTLGREAIDAKEEESRLVEEVQDFRQQAEVALAKNNSAERDSTAIARKVQDRIVSELKEFDYSYYTKNRFTITKVQEDLRAHTGEGPDESAHAEALKRLGEAESEEVREPQSPPTGLVTRLVGLKELLERTPTRVALEELQGASAAQSWVEQGLELHIALDHCLFCTGQIDHTRREALARHFDESWLEIRASAQSMLRSLIEERKQIDSWRIRLPEPNKIDSGLRPGYAVALEDLDAELGSRKDIYDSLESVLRSKSEDPGHTPDEPDWDGLKTILSTTEISDRIALHNERVRQHAQSTRDRKQLVLDHIVSSQSAEYRRLEGEAKSHRREHGDLTSAADTADRRLDELRKARFTTKDMADTLTADLARVYGKNHLSIAVTHDGKSYECRRSDGPGTDLSEGERTTLSLLYFLRSLEDEQTHGDHPSKRLVVVDDPSSSLDREAIFATHQWLHDRLRDYGQYVVLTHDFSLLRLFLKSHKNAWGKSMSKIRNDDPDEARFPKVTFLEIFADTSRGQRRSRIDHLPKFLLNNTSEYAYLFSMVLSGITDPDDHERLFLLPNAARRVLEVFASYKAPHRTDFLQQLEVLVSAQKGEPFRDVYDFCNRFSHGEGGESTDVLDGRTVNRQLRRAVEFMRSVDEEHFDRMCSATGNQHFVLPG